MRPKPIGIIGGAGPLAGAYLLERILVLCGKKYGCYRDADFPKVFLISFPFSEMLSADVDVTTLKKELNDCIDQLRSNGASVLAIACNTLHAFLEGDLSDLVHLPRTVAEKVHMEEEPLILCTSTSARFKLHKRFFPCVYPDLQTQQKIDEIIELILKGEDQVAALGHVIDAQPQSTIVLGCTELSLIASRLPESNKQIVDPLEVMANEILEKAFKGEEVCL